MMNKIESQPHVSSVQDLSANNSTGNHSHNSMDPPTNDSRINNFSLFDSGFFGDFENDLSVDFLGLEKGLDSTPDRISKLDSPTEGDIPKFRRRRKETLVKITKDDFEDGAERNAFILIDYYANVLFSKNSSLNDILKSISFFFSIDDNKEDLTFSLCCQVLDARLDVFRLRLHYEWWLRGTIFTGPFPFPTVPLPSIISGEVTYYTGNAGYALMRECWVQPGIPENELINCVTEHDQYSFDKLKNALSILESRFLMSFQADRCYATGRNPMMINMRQSDLIHSTAFARGGSYHWSSLFGKLDQ